MVGLVITSLITSFRILNKRCIPISGKMQVTMKLDQRLMMSQQLRQAITLLQYNTLDLKQLVQQCIETNPLIDVEEIELEDNQDEDQIPAGKFSADLADEVNMQKMRAP